MARKTRHVTITEEGRDKGKVYLLTEMPSWQAEKWAARAFLALAKSGIEVPDNIAQAGFAGLAVVGFRALSAMHWEEAEPLMDEMMECVKIVRNPENASLAFPLQMDEDIEEVATRVKLRMELFELHTGFSLADAKSILTSTPASTSSSPNTQTSSESTAT